MEPYPSIEVPVPDPDIRVQESMWQLRSDEGAGPSQYPERPSEPNCTFYMRTGLCGYGDRCRYNHPRDRGSVSGAARAGSSEYPEYMGQPACQYFLKTGTCKYGSTCKYDHPKQGIGLTPQVSLNFLGYPLRLGVKECSYYMRTGQCKFGSTCKFHHPQPTPTFPASHQYPTVDSPRPPVFPYMQGPYGPMLISSGAFPVPSWSPYPPPVSPVVSPGGQHSIRANKLSPSAPAYMGPYRVIASSHGPSRSNYNENRFPERQGKPECQYYMRTGDCKFGSTCKYHHPSEGRLPDTNCVLSPIGLPLRPGTQPCTYYAQHGICKFGATCKFDHPMGTLSYTPSSSSLYNFPVAPYHVGPSVAALALSSSSPELYSKFSSGKDSFSTPIL